MRVFLKTRGLYYRTSNQVVDLPDEALEFGSVAAAAECALRENLPRAEIAVRCDLLNREIGMPVLREWCELGEKQRLTVQR